jgi:hypothetical protein
MKTIVAILLIAAFGISAGWWTQNQVTSAGTQALKVGVSVADTVGKEIAKRSTPTPTPHK